MGVVIGKILFLVFRLTNKKLLMSAYKNNYLFSLLIFTFLFVIGCGKDEGRQEIPFVYVNFTIYPTTTIDHIEIGGWKYFNSYGYRGVLIYRPSPDEFVAFERTCPYDPEIKTARIEVESSFSTAIDTTCGSRFILIDGSPFEGPAKVLLKQYRTSFNGNALHVFN